MSAVKRFAAGHFVVVGEVSIMGVARRIVIPFVWLCGDACAALHGEIDLDRRWFDVGPLDDSSVDATVSVFFNLGWDAR